MNFLQPVSTPRGHGYFIGMLTDGSHCQVAIREHGIQKNIILNIEQVTASAEQKKARQTKLENEPSQNIVDTQKGVS